MNKNRNSNKISVCIKLHCIKVRENKSAYYKTYAFNKYNKAWLNTNLAKTPTLFTVTNVLLQFKGFFYLHLPSFTLFGCKNVALCTKQDISRALSCLRVFFSFSFGNTIDCKQNSLDLEGQTSET